MIRSVAVRLLGWSSITFFVATAFTPFASYLDRSAAIVSRLEPSDAIVVPGAGGASSAGILSTTSAVRTLHAIALYRRGLAPLVVFCGSRDEATARVRLARDRGVPPEAILPAIGAHTTREEAQLVADLVRPRDVRTILLVAHSFDLVRAQSLFRRVGFRVGPAPTDELVPPPGSPEQRLILMRSVLEESAARLFYLLAGYL